MFRDWLAGGFERNRSDAKLSTCVPTRILLGSKSRFRRLGIGLYAVNDIRSELICYRRVCEMGMIFLDSISDRVTFLVRFPDLDYSKIFIIHFCNLSGDNAKNLIV